MAALTVGFFATIEAVSEDQTDGAQLVRQHCGSCHAVPMPDVLPNDTWPYLLDLMGLYFGYDDGRLLASIPGENVRRQLFDVDRYPDQPLLTRDEWVSIRDYYESSGGSDPVSPPPDGKPLTLFEPSMVFFDDPAPVTSLVQIDPSGTGFFLADARGQTLHTFDTRGQLVSSKSVPGIPVQMNMNQLILIGSLPPSNAALGAIAEWLPGEHDWQLVTKKMHRPVHAVNADFDLDGDEDILACEFGHYVGRIGLYERKNKTDFELHVISTEPGAVAARLLDRGDDKLPDVLVLNAQAREGIVLLRNRGNLQFDREVLLVKHPGFGYTDMHMMDLDGDGTDELLTVNGDNGDLPGPPLKAYHGLRIYKMLPGPMLEEQLFLPLQGAFRAAPGDFDGDGDIDIAAISFFPDPRSPEQGFVYFENKGDLNFSRKIFAEGSLAPWMTMGAGDVDNDGDLDLVLGSGFVRPQQTNRSSASADSRRLPAALLLRNKTMQHSSLQQED